MSAVNRFYVAGVIEHLERDGLVAATTEVRLERLMLSVARI